MWIPVSFVWMACAAPDTDERAPDTDGAVDTDLPVDTDVAGTWPTRVPLPYAVAGEVAPTVAIELPAEPPGVPISVTVDAPFRIVRAPAALGDGPVEVSVDLGSGWAEGDLRVDVDGDVHRIRLGAIVGDPGLPETFWRRDPVGVYTTVALPHAPFPDGSAPWTDASVFLAVPPGPRGASTDTVLHLHGHRATLAAIVATHHLREQLTLSGRDALLIVPQGPVEAASGDFGRLADPGGHAALVADAWAVAWRDGVVDWPVPDQHALTAHSGGYLATAAILRGGGLPVSATHLFDAMYGERATFVGFALDGGVLRSDYTTSGGTVTQNEAAAREIATGGVIVGDTLDDDALDAELVTIAWTPAAHMDAPTVERIWARALATSGLSRRPGAPPELRAVVPDGDDVTVSWRADPGPTWVVEGHEGDAWVALARTSGDRATVPPHAAIRVRADVGGADPSDVYGATGDEWLVVDGFDRTLGGSWLSPTHDFAARLGDALGRPFASASDEAVAAGDVDLADYAGVLWFLGDESTNDVPLSDAATGALLDYVALGGVVILSGSELGYADPGLLAALGLSYVADDAGSEIAGGWPFGVVYPEDYPDVLDGPDVLWRYGTGGGAAVRADDAVAVGFALETMTDTILAEALPTLLP